MFRFSRRTAALSAAVLFLCPLASLLAAGRAFAGPRTCAEGFRDLAAGALRGALSVDVDQAARKVAMHYADGRTYTFQLDLPEGELSAETVENLRKALLPMPPKVLSQVDTLALHTAQEYVPTARKPKFLEPQELRAVDSVHRREPGFWRDPSVLHLYPSVTFSEPLLADELRLSFGLLAAKETWADKKSTLPAEWIAATRADGLKIGPREKKLFNWERSFSFTFLDVVSGVPARADGADTHRRALVEQFLAEPDAYARRRWVREYAPSLRKAGVVALGGGAMVLWADDSE